MKYPNISEEMAAAQRREAIETRPQDRLVGRRKFQFCHRCGSRDGMQSVHREVVADFGNYRHTAGFLHKEPGNDEYLFYPCYMCNPDRIVPDGYEPMEMADVLAWIDERDPMARDSAGM